MFYQLLAIVAASAMVSVASFYLLFSSGLPWDLSSLVDLKKVVGFPFVQLFFFIVKYGSDDF